MKAENQKQALHWLNPQENQEDAGGDQNWIQHRFQLRAMWKFIPWMGRR